MPGDFAPVQQSSSPIWKPQQEHKGLTEITVRHRIKSDLPRGRFDWLKHGAAASVAIFHAEEARSSAPTGQVHNTYLYPSLWNIYTFTLFIYVLLLICSPPAVFLIYVGRFACCVYFTFLIFISHHSPCAKRLRGN